MNTSPAKKIEQLQREIISLQKVIRETQKKMNRNKQIVNELYRMADLLQSYIPERGKWREAYRGRHN